MEYLTGRYAHEWNDRNYCPKLETIRFFIFVYKNLGFYLPLKCTWYALKHHPVVKKMVTSTIIVEGSQEGCLVTWLYLGSSPKVQPRRLKAEAARWRAITSRFFSALIRPMTFRFLSIRSMFGSKNFFSLRIGTPMIWLHAIIMRQFPSGFQRKTDGCG